MGRTPLTRFAAGLCATALCVAGLSPPAHAAPTTTAPTTAAPTYGILRGEVVTAAGETAAGISVHVYDVESEVAGGTTDADGRYEFDMLRPGQVWIRFGEGSLAQWGHGKRSRWEAESFTITAGNTTTVDETLLPTGTLRGRFVDRAGEQLAGARVIANEVTRDDRLDSTTDEDGRFDLAVPPGEYTVGFGIDTGVQFVPGKRDFASAARFVVAAGQVVTVEETLLPTGTISGRLLDAKGDAVAGAAVSLGLNESSDGQARTDEKGAYTLRRVFPGAYRVSFDPPAWPVQWAYGKTSAATATPITVAADTVTTVNDKLLATGTIAGKYTKRNGDPLKRSWSGSPGTPRPKRTRPRPTARAGTRVPSPPA